MNKEPIKITFTNSDKICLIDKEDWDLIKNHKWSVAHSYSAHKEIFYAITAYYDNETKKSIMMHRLILQPPKGLIVDHINHDGLDNRRSNLEVVTYSENFKRHRPFVENDARFAPGAFNP